MQEKEIAALPADERERLWLEYIMPTEDVKAAFMQREDIAPLPEAMWTEQEPKIRRFLGLIADHPNLIVLGQAKQS